MNDFDAPPQDQSKPEQPVSRRRFPWGLAIGCLLLLAVVAAVIDGVHKNNVKQASSLEAPQLPVVKMATARLGPIGFYVEALGNVTPVATVNVYSQITGRVIAVHYSEGRWSIAEISLSTSIPGPMRRS